MAERFGSPGPGGTGQGVRGGGDVGSPAEKGDDGRPPIPKRQMSPAQLAAWSLTNELKAYPSVTKDMRQEFHDEMLDMPQLRKMNMGVLAAALVFIEQTGGDITPQAFQSRILDEIIEPLTPDPIPPGVENRMAKVEERDIIIVKLKASVLRYMIAVVTFRREATA